MGINKCLCLDGCTAPMHALHDFVSYVLYINTVTQSIYICIYIHTGTEPESFMGGDKSKNYYFFVWLLGFFFFFFFGNV
jgi:hypothetical protein